MPLPSRCVEHLTNFSATSEDFALFGIFLNPGTGEMGTYSSHGLEPGRVLGFLQEAVSQMVTAAANNELEYIGGNDAQTVQPKAQGAKLELVH